MHQLVVVLDFGSQYTQLIARRIREQSVYCEIHPYTLANDPAKLRALNPIGIVLSGGPSSVYEDGAPHVPAGIFELGIPMLGICYGAQLTALSLGVGDELAVWASHGDHVDAIPPGFTHTAESDNCSYSGFANEARKIHCVQ